MVVLLSTTIISCSQAITLINNLSKVVGLTEKQKTEITFLLRQSVQSCPVKIKGPNDELPSKKSGN